MPEQHPAIWVAPPAAAAQRDAARVAGAAYLAALLLSMFAEFYVRGQLLDAASAVQTARNIHDHELLFRLGIAGHLLVLALDVLLTAALYVVLRPIDAGLALAATFWRLIETATMVAAALADLDALRVLGTGAYLASFDAAQRAALARLSIGAHGASYGIGLLFFGLGSTVFAYLWLRSRYVPRGLAALGIGASLLVVAVAFANIVAPPLAVAVSPACYLPIFAFELAMGAWLLFQGLDAPHARVDC